MAIWLSYSSNIFCHSSVSPKSISKGIVLEIDVLVRTKLLASFSNAASLVCNITTSIYSCFCRTFQSISILAFSHTMFAIFSFSAIHFSLTTKENMMLVKNPPPTSYYSPINWVDSPFCNRKPVADLCIVKFKPIAIDPCNKFSTHKIFQLH